MENIELAIKEFKTALLQINRIKAAEIFENFYINGTGFNQLEILAIRSLEQIGEGWERGNVSLSQVYMSGVICEELIEKYLPIFNVERKNTPKIAIGVLQDHHALGKRIVYSMLGSAGYEVLDFGQGLSVDELVNKTIENKIEVLLISTLMLPSALKVKEVREKLIKEGHITKIIVGGAPFRLDSDLWKNVQADADGKNASDIVSVLERVVNV
jgi:methanogenic corrinoid protein MtbC1